MLLPHPRVKVSIVGSLRDREVACSASDRQGPNFESCVWRTVSSQSSHHPQEVLLAQFSLYVHKGGLKPDSFHFISPGNSWLCLKSLHNVWSHWPRAVKLAQRSPIICFSVVVANIRCSPNYVVLMVDQRRRGWATIQPTLAQRTAFAGIQCCVDCHSTDEDRFIQGPDKATMHVFFCFRWARALD